MLSELVKLAASLGHPCELDLAETTNISLEGKPHLHVLPKSGRFLLEWRSMFGIPRETNY